MSYTDAFLQAILNDPEDETVRLIYADWLEERGDPRGEFIRVQCCLSGLPIGHPERGELRKRERELLRQHAAEWSQPVSRLPVADWTFRRGFIEEVTMGGDGFLHDAKELFDAIPLRCLCLQGAAWCLPALVANPWLSRVAALDLDLANRFRSAEDIRGLGIFPNLRRLNLSHVALDDARLDILLAMWLPRLTALDLSRNQLTARGSRALVSWPHLGQLRELYLNHNHLGCRGVEALLAALQQRPPEILMLEGNGISSKFLQTLLRRPGDRGGCRGDRLPLPCPV
jgi:uncharacterized protein (TIGR02996 family)